MQANPKDDPKVDVPADDEDWRARVTPEQFEVTRNAGTERAFTGAYWDTKDPGLYRCVVCNQPLFRSDTKYDSGTGWPSFWEPVHPDAVRTEVDTQYGMTRTEVLCASCGSHLGHVFPDGPRETTGLRYCMNSASLDLDPDEDTAGADGADA